MVSYITNKGGEIIVKDYTINEKEQNTFILKYKKTNNALTVYYANGKTIIMPMEFKI